MCQKSSNLFDAFMCYQQKCKVVSLNLAHPVQFCCSCDNSSSSSLLSYCQHLQHRSRRCYYIQETRIENNSIIISWFLTIALLTGGQQATPLWSRVLTSSTFLGDRKLMTEWYIMLFETVVFVYFQAQWLLGSLSVYCCYWSLSLQSSL